MRRSGWTKWLIVIPAMLGIVLVTYVRYTTDIWGFGAFICQLIAILELAYGLRIAMLAQNRKKSYRLTPEERHEYARYLYCLLYTSPSPRDGLLARMPSSA